MHFTKEAIYSYANFIRKLAEHIFFVYASMYNGKSDDNSVWIIVSAFLWCYSEGQDIKPTLNLPEPEIKWASGGKKQEPRHERHPRHRRRRHHHLAKRKAFATLDTLRGALAFATYF